MELFKKQFEEYRHLFGLQNWNISLVEAFDQTEQVSTKADPRYFTAVVSINSTLLRLFNEETEKNRASIKTMVIHELIHVVMSLYDFYADNLGKEGSQELFYTAREASTSQLTHIILRLMDNDTH